MKTSNLLPLRKTVQMSVMAMAIFCASLLVSQNTYTFSSAGASGRTGPSQLQVNAAYATTNLNGLVSIHSQGIQEWVVPYSGNYIIETWGAGGTNASALGAKIKGTFSLNSGQVLYIAVGQQAPESCGGNGGSFVATGTSIATSIPLIVAGGGGGYTAYSSNNGLASYSTSGNDGNVGHGGAAGSGGQCNINNTDYGGGGGGGFYSDGQNTSFYGVAGSAFVNGANGGDETLVLMASVDGGFGGGGAGFAYNEPAGGGGYSGGGGGGYSDLSNVGGTNRYGGGGGSYNSGSSPVQLGINHSGDGCVIITQLIEINFIQTAQVLCYGGTSAALSASIIGGLAPYSYTWQPGGSNMNAINNLAAGVYSLIVKDANNYSKSATYTISQPSAISVVSSQTHVSCFGLSNGSAALSVSGGLAPYSYQWAAGNQSLATLSNLSAANYSCTVIDSNNCQLQVVVGITQPAAVPVMAHVNKSLVCKNDSIVLYGSGADDYSWSDGVVDNVPFVIHSSKVYTVTGTELSSGCSNTAAISLLANEVPTISVSGGSVCAGQAFVIHASGASTYTFSNGSNVSPLVTTTYSVIGSSLAGCISNTAYAVVQVIALPQVGLSSPISSMCVNEGKVTLMGVPAGGSYVGEHLVLNSFEPSVAGLFNVLYSYSDPLSGCENKAGISLQVMECVSLNEEMFNQQMMSIYPNPNSGIFQVDSQNDLEKIISVCDLSGKVLVSKLSNERISSFDISAFEQGVYFVRIQSNNNIRTQKLIKN